MERQALKSLQDDNSIIILPADEGNATVVMDRVEYSNKLADLIGNGGYCKQKKDPNLKTERKLSQILGKNKNLIPQTKYRQLIQHYSKLPHISSSSSSYRAGSTDIPDPLSPLLPIVHRPRQVFRTTSCILTQLLNVRSCWSSCFCAAVCRDP